MSYSTNDMRPRVLLPQPGPSSPSQSPGLWARPLPLLGSDIWAHRCLLPALCPCTLSSGPGCSCAAAGIFPLSAPAHPSHWPGCSAGLSNLFVLRCSQPIMTRVHPTTPPPPGCGSSVFSWDETRKISNIDFFFFFLNFI